MSFVSPWWDAGFAAHTAHGEHAQRKTAFEAFKFCKERRRGIDVGAHIGIWTDFMAERFKFVDAFEPVLENFSCLTQNVTAENVMLHPVAIGERNGRVSMERHDKNSGCWHTINGKGVEILPLDAFDFHDVDLLKIDVEGLEGAVLRGAQKTLESKPVVVIEDNGLGPRLYGEDWVDPKIILREHGYALKGRIRKDEIWAV